jgi:hypothetical protein
MTVIYPRVRRAPSPSMGVGSRPGPWEFSVKRQGLLRRALIVAACAALLFACPGSAEPAGPDEACFRALDCQDGLVCIEGRCTADITSIVPGGQAAGASDPQPEAAADAGPY